ncbi:hypothetical protein CAEBREN_32457 [Caenorhabditis brenneri]|uniref:Acyl_transf_3 domain-containing protein n=1 Tax=Caenorhabditis brenneri TaxID=135651 RepID=G0P5S0_CAEBE|nr:hypothetical protein CAEBREN_32457 [Caenorhabditis brenneri]
MICLYNFFPDTAIETNQESAIHALLFVSNRPKTVQEDYFQLLAIAVDIFTHTWSLSVEIQFYFLVPFIFLFATKIPEKFQYFYYGTIGLLSFVYFYSSLATIAFNSVFARIWQFLIGMVVYLLGISKSEFQYKVLNNEEDLESDDKIQLLGDEESQEISECCPNEKFSTLLKYSQPAAYTSLGCLVFITVFPLVLPATVVRPLVTMGTGFLMLISDENLILSNRFLTYIGDISYSLYLIHWPIYAYWKLTCDGNKYLLVASLTAAVILAIITFETYEKWYLKLSSTSIGLIVVMLFFLNVVVINKDEISDHIDSIGRNFSSLDNVTDEMTVGCEPLYPSAQSKMCKANFTDFEEHIRKEKPDYAFIFTRYMSIGAPFAKNVTSFKDDPIYQTMKEQMLKFISNIKYKLYILDALPRINRGVISKIAPMIKNETDPVIIDNLLVRPAEYEMARKRHAQLVKDCKGKCVMVDYVPEFYNNETKTFRYFDERGFSYWTTPSHLSPHGIEHIRHVWTDICTNL